MIGKDNDHDKDEAYQFPEDEYTPDSSSADQPDFQPSESGSTHADHESATASSSPYGSEEPFMHESFKDRFPFLKNTRLLFVIGAAVLAIIFFKLFSPSHAPIKVVKKATEPTKTQSAKVSELMHVSQMAADNEHSIQEINQQFKGISTQLQSSQDNQRHIKDALMALANQVEALSASMKAHKVKPHHHKANAKPYVTYHLRAVVPGRAWIMGSDGLSDSVTVGSKIPHYGKVTDIQVEPGVVITSSGKKIGYNSHGD